MIMNFGLSGIALILITLFLIFLPIPLAMKRDRNPVLWFLAGLILSPLLTIPLLLILGQKPTTL